MEGDAQPVPASAADRDLRYVMAHANCLLWHAEVAEKEGEPGAYVWQVRVFDEDAAQRFLPLDLLPGESFMDALHRNKHPDDVWPMNRVSAGALSAGAAHYRQDFRCHRAD